MAPPDLFLPGSFSPNMLMMLTSGSFNCNLPVNSCGQFAPCNGYTGKCDCPAGFGGDDCLEPRTSENLVQMYIYYMHTELKLTITQNSLWFPSPRSKSPSSAGEVLQV